MKPRVLVVVLCGSERAGWVCPGLAQSVVAMTHEPRFEVSISWLNARPIEHARNVAIDLARKKSAHWLVQLDNDVHPGLVPLDMIAEAGEDMHVLGAPYGIPLEGGVRLAAGGADVARGQFTSVEMIGAGCLAIRARVWETIRGPWFRTVLGEDELLSPAGGMGEDVFFCHLAHRSGFEVWAYRQNIPHMKTLNATQIALQAKR